jgi:ABC-2 type transport system permease protein
MIEAIFWVTLRGLVSRRRSVLMVLLAALPIAIALVVRLAGRPADPERLEINILDGLVVRTVLPLVALVLGTAALGSELEDGTGVYLLIKPIARWRIVAAKLLAAGGLTALLVAPPAIVTGLILAGDQGDGAQVALAYGVATVVGAFLYASVFLAVSIATGRALVIGLVYTLLWEGLLAGLFAGSRALSIREYTVGVAGLLDAASIRAALDGTTTIAMSLLVFAVAVFLASRWLAGFQVRGSE